MARPLAEMIGQAARYAAAYAAKHDLDAGTQWAIFIGHLAHLINTC